MCKGINRNIRKIRIISMKFMSDQKCIINKYSLRADLVNGLFKNRNKTNNPILLIEVEHFSSNCNYCV